MTSRITTAPALTIDQFVAFLRRQLLLNDASLSADTEFVADLEMDSLQLCEVLILVEDLGVMLDEDVLATCHSVRDLHVEYLKRVRR